MKKVFIGFGITIVSIAIIITIFYVIFSINFNSNLKAQGLTGIGKNFTVEVPQNIDYTIFNDEEFDIWNEKERNKMIEYMKEENIKLKAGTYTINQANTFEKALEIFEFE